MKILVVGGGGREHALAWRLGHSGHQVVCAPGNPGIASVAECVAVSVSDLDGLCALARERAVDLVVVGPEAPLCAGLADRLRADGARLEGSKVFSKQLFARHGIRTADFRVCTSVTEAELAVGELGGRVVVKADGLAAGKGVVVCSSASEAIAAAAAMLDGRFGDAGKRLVIEARLVGRELSVMAVCDGNDYRILAPAEDHKAAFDGDQGPNTGGMGTVSPAGWASDALLDRVARDILDPTVAGLRADGIDFRGVLYAGLMVAPDGQPWLLEYNCRFGDPETQPVMARFTGDLGDLLARAARGELGDASPSWDPRTACCVVMAAAGYPESPRTGDAIGGLDGDLGDDVVVFHAGTARKDGRLVTAGGRVLGVTALGHDLSEARARAYHAVETIHFDGAHWRRDIGLRPGKEQR